MHISSNKNPVFCIVFCQCLFTLAMVHDYDDEFESSIRKSISKNDQVQQKMYQVSSEDQEIFDTVSHELPSTYHGTYLIGQLRSRRRSNEDRSVF